ncbi:MAG: RAD55 family ATPase [Nitrososphaerota archaeon]
MSVFGESKDVGPKARIEDTLQIKQKEVAVSTGIPGFDETLGQGLPTGNLYLISGQIGSSSNQLVQQILYNTMISKGKVAYYTVENSSPDIIQDMQLLGMNIQQYVDEGTWIFGRVIPPSMKKIIEALPEVPMEQRIELDTGFTTLMNHYYDMIKEGRNTALHLPLLVRSFPLNEVQNLLFYITGVVRRYGGIHFLLLTEGAHDQNTMVTIKDTVDSVFDVTAVARGAEIENIITISKIRSMVPKARVVRLAQRESGLATETIRRVQ